MSEAPLLFLDANALASPVTPHAADRWGACGWSAVDLVEACRGRSRSARSRTGIADLGCAHRDPRTELSPTAQRTEDLVTDTLEARQVMADAIHAGARYLITTDVDDFAFDDLAAHGMSAVNLDYFMASRFTEQAYM